VQRTHLQLVSDVACAREDAPSLPAARQLLRKIQQLRLPQPARSVLRPSLTIGDSKGLGIGFTV